ncbi:MAG: pyruvate, phosphate dikinase [Alphaproteobacteria bacterium]|nr:pyruvate, phosphate dikinase [Alphaproteobacteria bacterium]
MGPQASNKWVYDFGGGASDGDASMKNLLGGKGANLAEMSRLGLPVPPGFTLTTEVCTVFYDLRRKYPTGLEAQVEAALQTLEAKTGKRFGDPANPLLVSVRSGSRASMPGMMDTVLNLGLNEETAEGLAALSGDRRFAYDSYRRFIQMYSNVVLEVPHAVFEHILDDYKESHDLILDTELGAEGWREVIGLYKAAVAKHRRGAPFPDSPKDQLWGAIGAVFSSWMNDRAVAYRRLNDIPQSWGTAVNVQAMVFGNMGETSATGVAFTRDPSTGERRFYGEFLVNAQGEDVVAGIRTPASISRDRRLQLRSDEPSLEEAMPDIYARLTELAGRLETHYRDMQDIEFTVERGALFVLQTRSGKRTAQAAMKMAVEMCREGLISRDEAVLRLDPSQLDQLLHPAIAEDAVRDVFVKGLPASPGAAVGQIVFDSAEAVQLAQSGLPVILVRVETSPEDIRGMHAARAIVTARGGMTSHAAVVARGMGRPCVCGAGSLQIDMEKGVVRVGARELRRGDVVTVDGGKGQVLVGAVKMVEPLMTGDFDDLMTWADRVRRLDVRANAETPLDAETARRFGAQGIGLCRTEHMFFDADRINVVREMILAETEKERRKALDKLLPMQRSDFSQIFRIMSGLPVTIRLLDPPLHEFLPHTEEDIADLARQVGIAPGRLRARIAELAESNPMLGHRGCRLGITYPEIYEMQARAIFEAALDVARETGAAPVPEVMIPLVATRRELQLMRERVVHVAERVFQERRAQVEYLVGTMIELPRAALRAAEIAEEADFFSFGTNDLTQTALGISRDDAARFLRVYEERGIYDRDPFATIDRDGVGELVRMGCERGRKAKPGLKLGVCGEHGGDPASILFFEEAGLDYVSCSPYRVPVARLAAAHAVLRRKR